MFRYKLYLTVFLVGLCSWRTEAHPIGLVFAGGGARGAYEVGVWQALCELGLTNRIQVISGTSVGALNAALFASVRDPVRCAEIWQRTLAAAFTVNTNVVRSALQKTVDDYSRLLEEESKGRETQGKDFVRAAATLALSVFVRSGKHVERSISGVTNSIGVCDSSCLRMSLKSVLPEEPLPQDITVYASAAEKARDRGKTFCLNGLSKGAVIDRLMASAALPIVFESVAIDGVQYLDGGYEGHGGDNIPITPVLDNHPNVRTVIVVYLKSRDKLSRRLVQEDFPGVRLVEIIPSKNIGRGFGGWQGVFDSSEATNDELIKLGYQDAKAVLNGARLMSLNR